MGQLGTFLNCPRSVPNCPGKENKMKKVGIYVHIPFCKQKCKYCDFVSFQCMDDKMEDYFNYLTQEILDKSEELNIKKDESNPDNDLENNLKECIEIDTIYIGGGTPSIVSEKYIEKIIFEIQKNYKVSKNAEITIEINPGTVDENKLKKYFQIGINRISIGLQSTNNKLLDMLGRIHTYEEFEKAYLMARKVGFKNINVDLMIGLPNQSIEDIKDSLNKIIEKSPEHISVYSLIVEENTKMYELIEENVLQLPDEELERKMYWEVKNILEKNGYNHYEISNFSKPNFKSKHNMNCWNQQDYLGFGVAAHSYFKGMRYSNIDNLKQYIENYKNGEIMYNRIFHENQSKEQMMKEYMLLGLRKISGVSISEFKNKFVDNPLYVFRNELNKLVNESLIEIDENSIKLSEKGIDLANMVWMEFV